MEKTCRICKITKDVSEFYFRKDNNTFRSECKQCIRTNSASSYEENKEERQEYNSQWHKDNKEYISIKRKEYYQNNKNEKLQKQKDYSLTHKEEKKEYDRKYYLDNKEEYNAYNREYSKKKRKTDPCFNLRKNVSRLVVMMLKTSNGTKNGKSVLQYLPYNVQDLKNHIESLFEPWMNWENYGQYKVDHWDDNDPATWTWQIDHIIPQSDLRYFSMEEESFQKCWALSNLRPLSAKQNLLDGVNKTRHSS